jgi:hypothetical protein
MATIACIKVYLDDNVPESMGGIIRISSVVAEDENGDEIKKYPELIDNAEYHSENSLIKHVAKELNISESRIVIIR